MGARGSADRVVGVRFASEQSALPENAGGATSDRGTWKAGSRCVARVSQGSRAKRRIRGAFGKSLVKEGYANEWIKVAQRRGEEGDNTTRINAKSSKAI